MPRTIDCNYFLLSNYIDFDDVMIENVYTYGQGRESVAQ